MFTLLQIDDVAANRVLIERVLAHRPGIRTLSAQSGQEGLAMALAEQPDLILLDIAMPDMNGPEVLDRLKRDPRTAEIPMVIFSGSSRAECVEKMLAGGAVGSLPKPFSVPALEGGRERIWGRRVWELADREPAIQGATGREISERNGNGNLCEGIPVQRIPVWAPQVRRWWDLSILTVETQPLFERG